MLPATPALNARFTPCAMACDPRGFELGWDHAHHGLAPPAGLLHDATPVYQGWTAAKAVFGRRTLGCSFGVRQWLALRTLAWRQGIGFESQQLGANYLAQLRAEHCPVLRMALGGAPGTASSAVIARLNPRAGYAAGHLATLSQLAASLLAHSDVLQSLRRARQAQAAGLAIDGLDAAAWWRLAALRSFVTPLPFFEAARVPLAVLPPNRVRLLNAVQGLQALVTLQFVASGWSARVRALAQMLPEHSHRHDFYLFIGALAPRALEADAAPQALRRALEDAWLLERVQRRWQHFVLSLGEAAVGHLLDRAAAQGLAGVRTLVHAAEQATEGWDLAPLQHTRPPLADPNGRSRPHPTLRALPTRRLPPRPGAASAFVK